MNKTNADFGQIAVIYRKELFELFRERRTVMAVIVGPLIITPILFALIGVMVSGQIKAEKVKTYAVGVVNGTATDLLELLPNSHLSISEVSLVSAQKLVKNHHLAAAVILPTAPIGQSNLSASEVITIIDDSGDSTSQDATDRLNEGFTAAAQILTTERIEAKGLPPSFANPFKVVVQAVKGGGSVGLLLLSTMLPYILIVTAFSGTIYAAFDQVAGEKERGSLETLLVAPISRMTIVLGKFLTVVSVCLLSCVLSIAGLSITFVLFTPLLGGKGPSPVHLSAPTIAAIALALIPLAIMFAGLLLTVSIYARNQKEAQTVLGPLFMLVILPAMMSMFINGGDVNNGLAFVPVLNAALIIKLALSSRFDPVFILLAFLSSIAYASIALIYAASLFQKEAVLLKA